MDSLMSPLEADYIERYVGYIQIAPWRSRTADLNRCRYYWHLIKVMGIDANPSPTRLIQAAIGLQEGGREEGLGWGHPERAFEVSVTIASLARRMSKSRCKDIICSNSRYIDPETGERSKFVPDTMGKCQDNDRRENWGGWICKHKIRQGYLPIRGHLLNRQNFPAM